MSNLDRTPEAEIAFAVLKILEANSTGEASIRWLKSKIPEYVALTPLDLTTSETRPNEELWEQRLRNIVSHKGSPGNYIFEGYLEHTEDGLRITEHGLEYVRRPFSG
jgi:hypothetical protein